MRYIPSFFLSIFILTGCGGGGSSTTLSSPAYTVSGTVSGLGSDGLSISLNAKDTILIANGATTFTFPTALTQGSRYLIDFNTQPKDHTCKLTFNSGMIGSAAISDVQILCSPAMGQYVYVTNSGSDNISAFTLHANTGAMAPVAGSPFPAGSSPQSITSTPSKKFLYVANFKDNSISGYLINASNGVLTPMMGSPFVTGKAPSDITVDQTGQYLLGVNSDDNTISIYAIDPSSGALSQITGSPVKIGNRPTNLQMDGSGSFVYVVNDGDQTIAGYFFNKNNGSITSTAGSPYPLSSMNGIGLQYANQILRVSGTIYFNIDPSSGALTPFSPTNPVCSWETLVLNDRNSGFDTTGTFLININQGGNSIAVLSRRGGSYCGPTYSKTPGSTYATGIAPFSALAIFP